MYQATMTLPSASTTDVYAFLVSGGSSVPLDQTPAYRLIIQNSGAGTVRLGDSGVNSSQGLAIGPSEQAELHLRGGDRAYVVASGSPAANVTLLLWLA